MPATYAEHAKGKSADWPASRTATTTTPVTPTTQKQHQKCPGVVRSVAKARNHLEKKQWILPTQTAMNSLLATVLFSLLIGSYSWTMYHQ